jgi:carbonic anhydrase
MNPALLASRIGVALSLLAACQSPSPAPSDATSKDTFVAAARPTHWAYAGEDGPDHWGQLDPVYATCANGTNQSPIELTGAAEGAGIAWKANYGNSALVISHNEHMEEIIDNGHTIQISVEAHNTIEVDGQTFTLKQFHFHTPSEHTLNGQHAPMEVHLVHQSEDGALAVLGLLVKSTSVDNPHFEPIVANLPDSMGKSYHHPEVSLALDKKLPANQQAYHYMGSLTTPPCSEGVHWLVMKEPIALSERQIQAIASRIGPNNRPVQATNQRKVELESLGQSAEQ